MSLPTAGAERIGFKFPSNLTHFMILLLILCHPLPSTAEKKDELADLNGLTKTLPKKPSSRTVLQHLLQKFRYFCLNTWNTTERNYHNFHSSNISIIVLLIPNPRGKNSLIYQYFYSPYIVHSNNFTDWRPQSSIFLYITLVFYLHFRAAKASSRLSTKM